MFPRANENLADVLPLADLASPESVLGSRKDRHRATNLQAEILSRQGDAGDSDPVQTRIGRLLIKALGEIQWALQKGYGFSDASDLAEEVLRLEPNNADALVIRAVASAELNAYSEAIEDGEKALALQPRAGSDLGVCVADLLVAWRLAARERP